MFFLPFFSGEIPIAWAPFPAAWLQGRTLAVGTSSRRMQFAPTVKSDLLNDLLNDYCHDDDKT